MTRTLRLTAVGLLSWGSFAAAQEVAPPFRYETQKTDAYSAERSRILAAALDFPAWPGVSELYSAPPVDRELLGKPAGIAEEVRSCTTVPFSGEPWPQCTWSWKVLSERHQPSPNDWLDLQVTQTPSGRAAQEFLLGSLTDNMLPTETLVARYKTAKRPENLGTVAFLVQAPQGYEASLSFIRANLVFRIRGHGALAAEVLPLATRLDERVLSQQPLTLEELRARRPK